MSVSECLRLLLRFPICPCPLCQGWSTDPPLCLPLSLCPQSFSVCFCLYFCLLSLSLSLYVSLCPAGLEGGHSKVCLSAAWRSCRGGCLHLSTEECQGLCLRRPLIMSVVSLWRPVINLRCCGDRAAGLTAGTQWGRRKWSRERMGWVGKVLQEERED